MFLQFNKLPINLSSDLLVIHLMWMSLASSSHISDSLPQALRCDRKVALASSANVLLIFHVVPLGSCFPQSLPVASIAIAFSLFSPRYNPFLKEKGLPYAYGQALESARPSAIPGT
ncbi:hypothetical protein AAW02_10470 [Aeromonas dhakensis]|nr:hypothetical protein AAW03_17195 [Aeromonas dhakensis]PHS88314.1 hypothetical protein AAW02_10470 [Aeromonas dhakensis]